MPARPPGSGTARSAKRSGRPCGRLPPWCMAGAQPCGASCERCGAVRWRGCRSLGPVPLAALGFLRRRTGLRICCTGAPRQAQRNSIHDLASPPDDRRIASCPTCRRTASPPTRCARRSRSPSRSRPGAYVEERERTAFQVGRCTRRDGGSAGGEAHAFSSAARSALPMPDALAGLPPVIRPPSTTTSSPQA